MDHLNVTLTQLGAEKDPFNKQLFDYEAKWRSKQIEEKDAHILYLTFLKNSLEHLSKFLFLPTFKKIMFSRLF
jgi:hypothetical protein